MNTSQAVSVTLHFIIPAGLILIMWGISGDLYLEPCKSILSRRTTHFLAVLFKFWKSLLHMCKLNEYTTVIINYTTALPCWKNTRIVFVKKGRGFLQSTCTSDLHVRAVADQPSGFWILQNCFAAPWHLPDPDWPVLCQVLWKTWLIAMKKGYI